MRNAIEIIGLTKRFGKNQVVKRLDLNIKVGEIFALVGLNGAGKTTTIKMLLGLIESSSGLIRYRDLNFDNYRGDVLPNIGVVLEKPGFYHNLTVYQNLKMKRNIVGSYDEDNIDDVLDTLDMKAYKHVKIKQLNTTQIQKLALCRALLNGPEILILDEPMNGLDPQSINKIRALLKRLSQERQVTILISSHILDEVEVLADRIGFIRNGKLIEVVSTKNILRASVKKILIRSSELEAVTRKLSSLNYKWHQNQNEVIVHAIPSDIQKLLKAFVQEDIAIDEIFPMPKKLEEMFVNILGSSHDKIISK